MRFDGTAKASNAEVHLSRKETEIQAFEVSAVLSGTYHVAAKICAKSTFQSFAEGKLNYPESFLLCAVDDAVLTAKKNWTEITPAPNWCYQIRNYTTAQVSVGFCYAIQKEPQTDFS